MKKLGVMMLPVALLLTGCAAPARMDQMTARSTLALRVMPTPLRGNVALWDVTGGEQTNPLWRSKVGAWDFSQAVAASLRETGLLAAQRHTGAYRLIAHLEELDQPLVGFNATVVATVWYSLHEQATGKEIYQRHVKVPFTATMQDAFVGSERVRLASEGAIRASIAQLIDDLSALNLAQVSL